MPNSPQLLHSLAGDGHIFGLLSPPGLSGTPLRVLHPAGGVFDVVVVQTSNTDAFSAGADALSGRPIYTVYLQVGAPKEWIMEYCLPNMTGPAQTGSIVSLGNPEPVTAPYPTVTVRPPEDWQHGSDYLLVHGFLDESGRLRDMKILASENPQQPLTDAVLSISSLLGVPPRSGRRAPGQSGSDPGCAARPGELKILSPQRRRDAEKNQRWMQPCLRGRLRVLKIPPPAHLPLVQNVVVPLAPSSASLRLGGGIISRLLRPGGELVFRLFHRQQHAVALDPVHLHLQCNVGGVRNAVVDFELHYGNTDAANGRARPNGLNLLLSQENLGSICQRILGASRYLHSIRGLWIEPAESRPV